MDSSVIDAPRLMAKIETPAERMRRTARDYIEPFLMLRDIRRGFNEPRADRGPLVTWDAVMGKSRTVLVCSARRAVMHLLVRNGYSQTAAGRLLGRDHTTICHGIRHPDSIVEWAEGRFPACTDQQFKPSRQLLRQFEALQQLAREKVDAYAR